MRRWSAAMVAPILEERSRFQHVVKHLYRKAERWYQVVPALGRDAFERAWAAGCPRALLDRRYPDPDDAPPACKAHVLVDHDEHLAPAYLRAVSTADKAGDFARLDRTGWGFVGERGVFVIVRETGRERRPEVKTAYRVVPRRGRRPEDFRKAALRKLRDKSSIRSGG